MAAARARIARSANPRMARTRNGRPARSREAATSSGRRPAPATRTSAAGAGAMRGWILFLDARPVAYLYAPADGETGDESLMDRLRQVRAR